MAALNDRLTADAQANRIGSALVTAQVALAVVTLAGAALLVRSFENARRVDMGFEARGLLLAGLNLSTGGYDRDAALRYVDRAIARTQTLPASAASASPRTCRSDSTVARGRNWRSTATSPAPARTCASTAISCRRATSSRWGSASRPAAISRTATPSTRPAWRSSTRHSCSRYLGGGDAIGRRITGWGRPIAIVGVVSDSKYPRARRSGAAVILRAAEAVLLGEYRPRASRARRRGAVARGGADAGAARGAARTRSADGAAGDDDARGVQSAA